MIASKRPAGAVGTAHVPLLIAAAAILPLSLAVRALPGAQVPKTKLGYNRDIRPILAENCFACHGPDSAARKADLRLDRRERRPIEAATRRSSRASPRRASWSARHLGRARRADAAARRRTRS